MFKKSTYFFTLGLLCLSLNGFAADNEVNTTNAPAADTEAAVVLADNLKDLEQCATKITVPEMKERLEKHNQEDELFVKVNDNEVFLLNGIINNTSLQRQLIYLLPQGHMQHFYTNNKKTADHMYRMLRKFQGDIIDVNGYRVVTDRDRVEKGIIDPTHHFWCIKLKYSRVVSYNSTWSVPIGFGWGWDWGWPYYHHRVYVSRHHGGHGGRGHHR